MTPLAVTSTTITRCHGRLYTFTVVCTADKGSSKAAQHRDEAIMLVPPRGTPDYYYIHAQVIVHSE